MKNIFKNALMSTVVFGMAIASGFAMDNNPPIEPVKKVIETEVVTEESSEVLQTGYAYMDSSGDCIQFLGTPPLDCTPIVSVIACTVNVGGSSKHLYEASFNTELNKWECVRPLFKENP